MMLYQVSDVKWDDAGAKISKYFTVRHAIWLPKWNRLAIREDGLSEDARAALLSMFRIMDDVQDYLGAKLYVHSAYRPVEYNKVVGGAKASAHIARRLPNGTCIAAVDFHADIGNKVDGSACDEVRARLLPRLTWFGLRMENKPGSNWVHLDTMPVVNRAYRYFNP